MATTYRANINPQLLTWARASSSMDIEYASEKLGVNGEKLLSWESGGAKPTIKQLRKAANVYKVNFGAFFLSEPPETFKPPLKDFRRHHGIVFTEFPPEVILDLRDSLNSREVAIELNDDLGEEPKAFEAAALTSEDPEEVAKRVRKLLGITFSKQKTLRSTRVSFNFWREAISSLGILVFQSSKIELSEMRGYSVFSDPFPIIVANRKDPYSARTFTILHEFTHLLLRSSGLCDLHTNTNMPAHEQQIEVFCNKVAAQTLVPTEYLLSYPVIRTTDIDGWTDSILGSIALDFGVSREVILRKLLDIGLTSKEFYSEHRERFRQEAITAKERKSGGFVPPSVDVVSLKGRQYVSLVLDAMNASVITPADASDYLGVKAKHFPSIEIGLEGT